MLHGGRRVVRKRPAAGAARSACSCGRPLITSIGPIPRGGNVCSRCGADLRSSSAVVTALPSTAARNLEDRTSEAVVLCRGVRFETTRATLASFGRCYLATLTEIDTQEPVYLDFSPEAFSVLLDALTVARHNLGRALCYVCGHRDGVVDLEALLEFVLLGWVVGVSLPLPPAPTEETPRGDHTDLRKGFNLRDAYQGCDSGVFHHLLRRSPPSPLPCRYDACAAPDMLLDATQEYEEPLSSPRPGCVPVSVEMDAFMVRNRNSWNAEFEHWAEASNRVSSIYMLQVTRTPFATSANAVGDVILMHAGSTAVFDLGVRRFLVCEGFVLGMNRTIGNRPGSHYDMLTVDVASDLDHCRGVTRLHCQPLHFDGDRITYFRVAFPKDKQRGGRMFRLKVDPFNAHIGDYICHDDLSGPLYMLRSMELFGTLVDIPEELHSYEVAWPPFTIDPHVARIKRRRTTDIL